MAKTSLMFKKEDTLPKLFRKRALDYLHSPAFREKKLGIWNEILWQESYENVKSISLGLVSLGLEPNDRVCLIGDSGPELYWSLIATLCARGIVFGAPVDSLAEEVKHVINFAKAKFVFATDQEQVDKLLAIKEEVPSVKNVIWCQPRGLTATEYKNNPWLISLTVVIGLGHKWEQKSPKQFDENIDQSQPDDVAFLFYTSGTTGLPKAAMRSNSSLLGIRQQLAVVFPIASGEDTFCTAMIAGMADPLFGVVPHITEGLVLNFGESPETLQEDLREIAPITIWFYPRYWEDIASTVLVRVKEAESIKRRMFDLCLPIGLKVSDMVMEGQKVNPFWKALYRLVYWLSFRPALDKVGVVSTRWGVTMGYVLGSRTLRFLRSLGFDLRQILGSTEAGMITAHTSGDIKAGSVGKLLPNVSIRISDDEELLVKSLAVFQGYLDNPEATAQAIDKQGWLHSGDAAYVDEGGHVFFIDRVSELRELSSQKKFSPQNIEAQMRFGAYIKDCMALGDESRDYVSAILAIDFKAVSTWAEKHSIGFTTFADLSQKDEVGKLVLDDILRVNSTLPEHARIKRYVLLHKEFDPDEGELTRTRKLRRAFVEQKYSDIINAIYTSKESVVVEATFTYKDGRTATIKADLKIRDVDKQPIHSGAIEAKI